MCLFTAAGPVVDVGHGTRPSTHALAHADVRPGQRSPVRGGRVRLDRRGRVRPRVAPK